MTLLLTTLLLGCSGGPTPSSDAPSSPALDRGWIAQVVQQPELFTTTVDRGGRDGWVALHDSRWQDAADGLTAGPGRARAHLELAIFYEDLADLSAVAWPKLSATWQERDPAVADGPLPSLAAAALAAAGPADDEPLDTAAAGLDQQGCLQGSLDLLAGRSSDTPAGCASGQPLQLDADGTYHDPLLYAAKAAQARRDADQALGTGGWAALGVADDTALDALLFSTWWSAADLAADLDRDPTLSTAGAQGPTLQALDLPDAGTTDDPQPARERVRALDQALDAWETATSDAASADGQALMADLRLVPQLRSRILLAWARQALGQDRAHQATAYLMLAHDVENARQLGPLNPPSLYALAAQASLRTGRTREALDYLSVLEGPHPLVRGLDETVGDLAVLEGLGRQGDSKEN